jgi:hypothetical protein
VGVVMLDREKEATIIANAIYEWHNRNVSNGFVFSVLVNLTVEHIQQLSHFAKQGVKVRLK